MLGWRRAQGRDSSPTTSGCGAQLAAAPALDVALDELDDELEEELEESDELGLLLLEAGTLDEEPDRLSVR